jgi:hypothetical protein
MRKTDLRTLKSKSCCGSKTTTLEFFPFLLAIFSYHTLMTFISQVKGYKINSVFKITQYQPVPALSQNIIQRISFLKCLTDKQIFEGKYHFSVHVFRTKVQLEV